MCVSTLVCVCNHCTAVGTDLPPFRDLYIQWLIIPHTHTHTRKISSAKQKLQKLCLASHRQTHIMHAEGLKIWFVVWDYIVFAPSCCLSLFMTKRASGVCFRQRWCRRHLIIAPPPPDCGGRDREQRGSFVRGTQFLDRLVKKTALRGPPAVYLLPGCPVHRTCSSVRSLTKRGIPPTQLQFDTKGGIPFN